MNIYVTRDGQNFGPYTEDHARQMVQQGQLTPSDLACPEGQSQWVPLGQVLQLPAAPTAPLSAAAGGVPVAQPASAMYPPPGAAPGYPGHAPQAQPGHAPGSLSAGFALQQALRGAVGGFTQAGLALALAVLGFGLPAVIWAAKSSGGSFAGFFSTTIGMKWGAIAGCSIGVVCLLWFVVARKNALNAKGRYVAMRGGHG